MSHRLLTIAGIYDGKTIQPLETITTQKEQRVLITFLEEPAPLENKERNGNGGTLQLPRELTEELQRLVKTSGTKDMESYVVAIMKQQLEFEKNKLRFYEITDQIRAGLNSAGLTEEEVLQDFDRFRRSLPRE